MAGKLDINMFSKIADTVCDFPDPEQEVVKSKGRVPYKGLTLNSTNYRRKRGILVKARR
jgi:hypothetical protein